MSILIRDCTVVTANGEATPHCYVGISDKKIDYVGQTEPAAAYEQIVEGNGSIVMPGLCNSHTHVAMSLLRGYGEDMPLQSWLHDSIFPFEAHLTGEDVYAGSLLGIAEMLATGTTSFTDMYDFYDFTAKAVEESGIKANLGRGFTCFNPEKTFRELPVYTEIKRSLENFHGLDDGRILVDVSPHAEYTTRPDILHDAAELAKRYHLQMHIHLSETKTEHLECVARHGKTPAQVLADEGILDVPCTAAHCVWLSDSDMELLGRHGTTVAHCPKSNLKLASGIARIEQMLQKGVRVAIGTDSNASNNRLDMLEEMRTAALLAKGISRNPCVLPAGQVLHMATKAGYEAQGRFDAGDIAVGMRADLVMLSAQDISMTPCHNATANILYAAHSGAVSMTMVDGRILYRNGEFTTLDIEKIRYHANACIDHIEKRRHQS